MPTQRPRIQVTLDEDTSGLLASLAEAREQSVSAAAAELIREALELHEEAVLSAHADRRYAEADEWASHSDAWEQ